MTPTERDRRLLEIRERLEAKTQPGGLLAPAARNFVLHARNDMAYLLDLVQELGLEILRLRSPVASPSSSTASSPGGPSGMLPEARALRGLDSRAEIVALLADIGARIKAGRIPPTELGWPDVCVFLDEMTACTFLDRIKAAIVALSQPEPTRIAVEVGAVTVEGPLVGPSGMPVSVVLHGPYTLDRILPGTAAVLEIPPRPRKT